MRLLCLDDSLFFQPSFQRKRSAVSRAWLFRFHLAVPENDPDTGTLPDQWNAVDWRFDYTLRFHKTLPTALEPDRPRFQILLESPQHFMTAETARKLLHSFCQQQCKCALLNVSDAEFQKCSLRCIKLPSIPVHYRELKAANRRLHSFLTDPDNQDRNNEYEEQEYKDNEIKIKNIRSWFMERGGDGKPCPPLCRCTGCDMDLYIDHQSIYTRDPCMHGRAGWCHHCCDERMDRQFKEGLRQEEERLRLLSEKNKQRRPRKADKRPKQEDDDDIIPANTWVECDLIIQ